MLMRTEPLRLLGTGAWQASIPMDAYRSGDDYLVHFDLPGVDLGSLDISVERNVLTVTAERPQVPENVELQIGERAHGVVSRRLFLGDALDTDHIAAHYEDGVLTLRIPISAKAKPRKIEIGATDRPELVEASPA